MSTKAEIRDKTIGAAKVFKSRKIEYDDVEIEIREPTVKAWGDILRNVTTEEGKMEFDEYLVWSIISCSYVPGTDEKVYEEADHDLLLGMPKSGWVSEFSDLALTMMSADMENVEKNSDAIVGDNASSLSPKS